MSRLLFLISILAFSSFLSCTSTKEETASDPITFTVEPAPEWTALFKRTSGWFGGDGIFGIPLSGSDSDPSQGILFLFSDTMYGRIISGELQEGFAMVNNSIMILKRDQPIAEDATFSVNMDIEGKPVSLFVPRTPVAREGDYYWLGDGFVNAAADSTLYVFAHRIRNLNDGSAFPIAEMGTDIIAIPRGSVHPYEDQRQVVVPFSEDTGISYGVGLFENTKAARVKDPDGYIYVYGLSGPAKELLVARAPAADFENFSGWKFYDGADWSADPASAAPVADSVSNEMSVSEIGNGTYALIYEYGGILPNIHMQTGPSPVGPFGPRQELWNTKTDITEEGLLTYNAKAHPSISRPGELLVSYNVNSYNFFEQIHEIPQLYRPRFLRVKFDDLSKN